MSYQEYIKLQKSKPRGKPFQKGNVNGKTIDKVLDTGGHQNSNEETVIKKKPAYRILTGTEPDKKQDEQDMKKKVMEEDLIIPDDESKDLETETPCLTESDKDSDQSIKLIESIDFKNGKNTLTIRFSKKLNRMYRVQIFLNDDLEIRPVTYTGSSTGFTVWNLLKGTLKK